MPGFQSKSVNATPVYFANDDGVAVTPGGPGDATGNFSKQPPRTKVGSAITTVGLTSTQIFAANPTRTKLVIQNLSTAADPLHLNLGAAATTGAGSIRLASGALLELQGTTEAVFGIATIAALPLAAWEF